MKNVPQILKALAKRGFRLDATKASTVKIYPPDKSQPFYSFHVGERGLHPLRRFAKHNWSLDLESI
jgi:hypothetical protein